MSSARRGGALGEVLELLTCPVCSDGLAFAGTGALACARSHTFDIARQGYVSLLDGRSTRLRSDTAPMVAARHRVHQAGVFAPVVSALATVLGDALGTPGSRSNPLIVDAGAGTGDYLAAALDRIPTARGLGIDLSKYCARSIVRSHDRAAAVVADIWRRIPIADDGADAVCSVFSPRNPMEFARILCPGGLVVVVTPEPAHLGGIRQPMAMLGIDAGKQARLRHDLAGMAEIVEQRPIEYRVALSASGVADLVAMGPNAFHQTQAQITERAAAVAGGGDIDVTIAVTLTVARRT